MLRTAAYVHWGTWVANCPRCPNVERAGRDPHTGHVGALTGTAFRCVGERVGDRDNGCQLVCPVDWPENVDEITYLLNLRPLSINRNWSPDETIDDLLVENIIHGILPPLPEQVGTGPRTHVLALNGRLTGALAIAASQLQQIEGMR